MRRSRLDPPAPADSRLRHPSTGTPSLLHPVVALVGAVDRRAVTAVDAGRLLGGERLTALHVVEPGEDVEDLARRWMDLRCSSVPLRTVDAAGPGGSDVAAAVVDAVVPDDPGELVTVVMGQVAFARRWHRWLHDRTADRIAAAVLPLAQVRMLAVPIAVAA